MKFYRCKKCGQIIAIVKETKVPVMCCGEKMEEIIPGTTDAAVEKHVPVFEVKDGIVTVTVGSVEHPMLPEHYIEWIAIKTKIATMPTGSSWKSFASVCMLCGIGFTVSMFIADLAYSPLGADGRQMLDMAKLGILCGTIISALVGALLLGRTLPKEDK